MKISKSIILSIYSVIITVFSIWNYNNLTRENTRITKDVVELLEKKYSIETNLAIVEIEKEDLKYRVDSLQTELNNCR